MNNTKVWPHIGNPIHVASIERQEKIDDYIHSLTEKEIDKLINSKRSTLKAPTVLKYTKAERFDG